MREIDFRGKRVDNGEWMYGSYFKRWIGRHYVHYIHDGLYEYKVIPETVSQYTGLKDKNGVKIYEGDMVKTHYANAVKNNFLETVVFHNGRFCAEFKLSETGYSWAPLADGVPHIAQDKSLYMESCKVIGNIHDNPELVGDAGGKIQYTMLWAEAR